MFSNLKVMSFDESVLELIENYRTRLEEVEPI